MLTYGPDDPNCLYAKSESLGGSARKTHNASLSLYAFLFILPEQLNKNIFNLLVGPNCPSRGKGGSILYEVGDNHQEDVDITTPFCFQGSG